MAPREPKLVAIRLRPSKIATPPDVGGAILSPFDAAEGQREAYKAVIGHDPPPNYEKGSEGYKQFVSPGKWMEENGLKRKKV